MPSYTTLLFLFPFIALFWVKYAIGSNPLMANADFEILNSFMRLSACANKVIPASSKAGTNAKNFFIMWFCLALLTLPESQLYNISIGFATLVFR